MLRQIVLFGTQIRSFLPLFTHIPLDLYAYDLCWCVSASGIALARSRGLIRRLVFGGASLGICQFGAVTGQMPILDLNLRNLFKNV